MKLFTVEEEASGNELLIDKLLRKKEEDEKSPLSITADLLKKRDDIVKDVTKHIKEEEEKAEEEEVDSDDTEDDTSSDEGEVEDKEEDTSDKGSEEEGKKEEAPAEDEASKDDDIEDFDKDPEALIGSALGDDSSDSKGKSEGKEEVAQESFSNPSRITAANWNSPIRNRLDKYRLALEEVSPDIAPNKETAQPVVYVKDEVMTSLDNLTKLAFTYIERNKDFVTKSRSACEGLLERITVFKLMVEATRYHFTHKLVEDREVLANISHDGKTGIRESLRAINKYLKDSSTATSLIFNNDFDKLKDSFTTNNFEAEEGEGVDSELGYANSIVGFKTTKVAIPQYVNYIKTKVNDFNYYSVREAKTEDIYNLPALSITEDKDMVYAADMLNTLMVNLITSLDTLNKVTENFNEFIDSIKVIAYNVQKDQYTSLGDLGLDEHIKDFIKFKLVMEVLHVNIDMGIDYVTSVFSALNVMLELKE